MGHRKLKRHYWRLLTLISPALNARHTYRRLFGKRLDLQNPVGFKQKLIALKVRRYNHDPLVKRCADKYAVRQYVEENGCGHLLNELLAVYDDPRKIDWEALPQQFVLKWNFAYGFNIICPDKSALDTADAVRKLKKWGRSLAYLEHGQLQYRVPKKWILAEKLLCSRDGGLPEDYKVYCFHGVPRAVLYIAERKTANMGAAFFDCDWNYLGKSDQKRYKDFSSMPPRPAALTEMVDAARKLSQGFPFVRVDFYDVDGSPVFGEMTFTPGTGNYASETDIHGRNMGDFISLESGETPA